MVGNQTQRGSDYVPRKQGTTAHIGGRKNQNLKISECRSKKKYSVSSNSPPCLLPSGNVSLVLRKKLGKIAYNRGTSSDFEAKQIRVWIQCLKGVFNPNCTDERKESSCTGKKRGSAGTKPREIKNNKDTNWGTICLF